MALVAFCLRTEAEESESAVSIALGRMADHSRRCLGIESVARRDEDEEIHGRAAIAEARQSWEALGRVMEQQTGLVLEDRGSEMLIRPKAAPKIHNGPVVERWVTLASPPEKWRTLGEALDAIKFNPEEGEMSLDIVETSMTYSANHAMRLNPGMMASLGVAPERITEQNAVRLANANCWCFESSEGIIINGQIHYPKKLVEGNVSFSGLSRQDEAVAAPGEVAH